MSAQEDAEFESFLDMFRLLGILFGRPTLVSVMICVSALVFGAPAWRAVVVSVLLGILWFAGMGRRLLERAAVLGSGAAMIWWLNIPLVNDAITAVRQTLAHL